MTSDYLKSTRSLEEHDELFRQERIALAEAAIASLKHTVAIGTASIGEAQQISSARIFADVQVATAKITVDTEVTIKVLETRAIAVQLEIQEHMKHKPLERDQFRNMIEEVGTKGSTDISEHAASVINKIENEARMAVERIKASGDEALVSVERLATDIANRVRENQDVAVEVLEESKQKSRQAAEVIKDAEMAAEKVQSQGKVFVQQILDEVHESVKQINEISDQATAAIRECVEQSDEKILSARNAALKKVSEIVSSMTKDTENSP